MISFEEYSLGQVWLRSMTHIMRTGSFVYDDDVRLKEVCNLIIRIDSISEDDSIIQNYANQERITLLGKKYATQGLVPPYTIDYGSFIYNKRGVNQIEWVIGQLKKKKETKKANIVLNIEGDDQLPCLSLIDFKYRNEKLNMSVVYRSQNVFASQPGNLLALRKIHNDVATNLCAEIGHMVLHIMSAHIHEPDFVEVERIISATKS